MGDDQFYFLRDTLEEAARQSFLELHDAQAEAARRFSDSLENQSMACAVEGIRKHIDELDALTLNIAITGESGVGKSSFVNAIRGLGDDDEQSAETGVTETTMKPMAYPHPDYPNVVLWDLPGIGTQNFKANEYVMKVNFERYDFFIIITADRFLNSCVDLAQQIRKMNKKFYFARSKIDENIIAERRKKKFDQQLVLSQIRDDCVKGLEDCGVESPVVFLISSVELGNYDFSLLQETMERELPEHKRDTLLLALPNVTMKIHQRKREALQARIWGMALLSAGLAAVPIPGLSICADMGILVTEIKKFYRTFGLDDESLENLSSQTGVPVEEFKAGLKSPLSKGISNDVILKMLTKAAGAGMMVAGHFLKMLPFLGSVPAAGMSFISTKHMLENCLQELADDAQSVVERALSKRG